MTHRQASDFIELPIIDLTWNLKISLIKSILLRSWYSAMTDCNYAFIRGTLQFSWRYIGSGLKVTGQLFPARPRMVCVAPVPAQSVSPENWKALLTERHDAFSVFLDLPPRGVKLSWYSLLLSLPRHKSTSCLQHSLSCRKSLSFH